jgi:hypothetical protein
MFKRSYKILVILTCLAFFASACGSQAENESAISTAVAQTVQAGDSLTEIAAIPTGTLENNIPLATLTPAITPTSEPTLLSAPSSPDCIHAELISEYPPDRTVYKPNDSFTKTWTIKNEGTCTWDSTYRLIFWSGELMGGATYYDLPETVPPGDEISISIFLKAPATEGFYVGYWRLQTPWNAVFGVGQYSQAFYTDIQVDKRPGQEYGILNVTYVIDREPDTGCPANVKYTVYATITTNGPFDFEYYWEQKDGNESAVKTLSFNEAGSKTISREWLVGRGNSPNDRWMQIIVVFPEYIEYSKAVWPNTCP